MKPRCAKCGRFVSALQATTVEGAYGPGLGDVTGVCKVHGRVEAVREEGWSWEDFFAEERSWRELRSRQ